MVACIHVKKLNGQPDGRSIPPIGVGRCVVAAHRPLPTQTRPFERIHRTDEGNGTERERIPGEAPSWSW